MVLICLEYTVATAFEIELNLFSLEEVMEHEHGVAAVRFVALGLDGLIRRATASAHGTAATMEQAKGNALSTG